MKLNSEQIKFYDANGYLILENLFSKGDVTSLKQDIQCFEKLTHMPNVICEDNGDIRSVFAPHKSSELFDRLYKDSRLVGPSKQLVDDDIYMYQYKINIKKAFNGDCWEWHQDYPYWHIDDNVPEPQMISTMILLQDTNSYQGSLMVIPSSHKDGLAEFEPKDNLVSKLQGNENASLQHSLNNNLKYTVAHHLIKEKADSHGIVNMNGPAGTVIFFHPTLFHASSSNISPYERDTAIVTYNSVTNTAQPSTPKRPDYVCATDTSKLVVADEVALFENDNF